jgi:hypothetical protein
LSQRFICAIYCRIRNKQSWRHLRKGSRGWCLDQVHVDVPPGTRSRDVVWDLTPTAIKLGLKGQP